MNIVKRLPTARERTEELERASLSVYATLAAESKGRDRYEEPDELRTVFQQDRDRIIHSKAFRRLKDKTQVFVAPRELLGGDHYRVRLTHTLETAQIGRTIARALRLNEDLVEAVALGHDLGHTPFGHAGEEALSAFTDEPFRHNEQSLRIVERLERSGDGLNLTWEVRDGVLHHPWSTPEPATPEGQVVRLADRIAYLNHDLDDAFRAGILTPGDLPEQVVRVLGSSHGERITTLVADVVTESLEQPEVRMSAAVLDTHHVLREFLFERVYERPASRRERDRAIHCLRSLTVLHLEQPSRLPPEFRGEDDPLLRRVVDYVAGMTDSYAVRCFEDAFVPTPEHSQQP